MAWVNGMDRGAFFLLNTRLTSGVLDAVMPFITDKSHFIAIGAVLVLVVLARRRTDEIRSLVFVALAVAAGDLAAMELKTLVARVRPCHALEGVRLLVGCGGSYSFPSGHATNIFAAMVLLSLKYRKYSPAFLAVALMIAYSRVYVGVHYPLDVLGGAVLGSAFGAAFYELDRYATPFIDPVLGRGRTKRVE